ncbi:MAG: cobyric acid synthase [Deltaproteobacteria bacterium]|nr:cobyric acid synthase [Deltaproteobacteria bacterium]
MKYRPLMILGSGSDVGKSMVVAALCRVFRQAGVWVAPFKAQNMALNSFITPEGGEMGRAQVVQSQAAGLAPHVDMNPILLKPSSEVGSQVIVHGKVYGNFPAREYYRHKPRLVRKVMESFRRLQEQYELIVLEGAGSAVELNLQKNDLVNFNMARKAEAATLLVADIDRGGIFASTVGTWHLLTRWQRRLLSGFIINKFRGDAALFDDGVKIIEKRTGRPVLGVLPYLSDLALPEEDSVALSRKMCSPGGGEDGCLRVGVVRLPHISNYTDFDPLEQEPGVALIYLSPLDSLDNLDLLIIPGTKNTINDLNYLNHTGWSDRIGEYARRGRELIGICGGFQILGDEVRDPLGVEGPPGSAPGLGLLPVATTLAGEKTTTQVEAVAPKSEEKIRAYEIHMGVTTAQGPGRPAFIIVSQNGQPVETPDGWVDEGGNVWGTYLHGLFDNDGFRRDLLARIRVRKGQAAEGPTPPWSYRDFVETQLDRLADTFRNHVDVEKIWGMIKG